MLKLDDADRESEKEKVRQSERWITREEERVRERKSEKREKGWEGR